MNRFAIGGFATRRALGALLLALAGVLGPAGSATAQTGTYNEETPADPASEARLKLLANELRCLVCQNQTIADSNADLAVDLRRQVREMIVAGKSDAEIKTYLVARYGDFVLYRPPVQTNTAFLWFGPFALLLVGIGVWFVLIRRKAAAAPAEAMSAEDEAKAKDLLDR